MELCRITLHRGKQGPLIAGHPWLFSGAIHHIDGSPVAGSEVAVHASEGRFIARGIFNPVSQIRVRLYSWNENIAVDAALITERIDRAIGLRKTLGLFKKKTDACRLVFSESDGLSGLTLDRFGSCLSLQITSLAMHGFLEPVLDHLMATLKPDAIYLRTEKGVRDLEGLNFRDGLVRGTAPEKAVIIKENGIQFEVNLAEGQKTGYYLDQRDNRARAAAFAEERRCLDLFCYTGGFSLNLAKAGAASVLGVDSSAPALDIAKRNAGINDLSVAFEQGDAVKKLGELSAAGEKYGLVVLDPPRFAHSSKGVAQALDAYVRLNTLVMGVLDKGAILVTCSCSGRVTKEDFRQMLAIAASRTGRTLRILEERGAAVDHPVNPACPETGYLKCFICHVE